MQKALLYHTNTDIAYMYTYVIVYKNIALKTVSKLWLQKGGVFCSQITLSEDILTMFRLKVDQYAILG